MEVVLAVIGGPHGIKGDVVLDVRTDQPDRRFQIGSRYTPRYPAQKPVLDDAAGGHPSPLTFGLPTQLTLSRWRATATRVVAGFAEIPDRSSAEFLRGTTLVAEVDPLEEPDAWYPEQLRGASVVLPDGTAVGTVSDLVALPGQDLIEISQPDGSVALVPLVKALVPEVDLEKMRIVIDPPAGLVAARPAD
jgi:16S rRNA processing protein RimM